MSRAYIPQELLYNISTYGQITPGLDPGYIEQSVRNIDPNFDWSGEFLLEFYRANDGVYQQLLPILNRIPKSKYPELRAYSTLRGIVLSVPIYGLTPKQIAYISGTPDLEIDEVMIITQRPGFSTIATNDGRSVVDVLLETIPGLTYQEIPPGIVSDTSGLVLSTINLTDEEIENYKRIAEELGQSVTLINDRPSTDRTSVIEIPLPDQTDLNRVNAALYLANPRTTMDPYNRMTSRGVYEYTTNIQMNRKQNYPEILNKANKQILMRAMPQYFPDAATQNRLPTDSGIVQAILRISPGYDLGDLLSWLQMKRRICSQVIGTDMYELMRRGDLTTMGVRDTRIGGRDVYEIEIPLDHRNRSYRVRTFLDNSGINYREFNVGTNPAIVISGDTRRDLNEYDVVQDLLNRFLANRVCILNYLPTFNEKGY